MTATARPPNLNTIDKEKTLADIRNAIRTSIPDDIKGKLPVAALTQSPAHIIATLRGLISDNSEASHRLLEAEGKLTHLEPGQKIADYIYTHRTLRRRMFQAAYPNISTEETSVRFAVNALEGHALYRDASRTIRLTGLPTSLNILEERLMEEELAMGTATVAINNAPNTGYNNLQSKGSHYRGRGRGPGRGRGNSFRE